MLKLSPLRIKERDSRTNSSVLSTLNALSRLRSGFVHFSGHSHYPHPPTHTNTSTSWLAFACYIDGLHQKLAVSMIDGSSIISCGQPHKITKITFSTQFVRNPYIIKVEIISLHLPDSTVSGTREHRKYLLGEGLGFTHQALWALRYLSRKDPQGGLNFPGSKVELI